MKVQINYGSSKLYGEKYKHVMEFDHYEVLTKKLKDIKCFYNEIYQDWAISIDVGSNQKVTHFSFH